VGALEVLRAHGASLILLDKFGSAPLHFAAHQGQADAVAWLAVRGAQLRQANTEGLSPMALAIESGSWLTVKALLDAGITLKEPVAKHGAALNIALQFDRPTMVALLIEQGAPVDLESNGLTPLLWAAARGRVDETRLLLAAGANPNLAPPASKALPLLLAAYTGHLSVVQLLVERGANVHATNPQGGTALRSAADAGHIEIVKYLLGLGARSDIRDKFGLLPIDYARRNGHADIVKLLSSPK
jgi:ankyrin repeat protein